MRSSSLPTSAVGHKPSFYIRFLDRRLCDAKQPLVLVPGDRRQSASSGRPRMILISEFLDHEPITILNFTVLPPMLDVEAVGSETWVNIRSEPDTLAAF